ncbi:transposase (fragment) [Candidatus Zixiibacteriota bacterium]
MYLYDLVAWAIMPDHMHLLINPKRAEMPGIMRKIKLGFSAEYRKKLNANRGRIWQNRYWDHIIRNESDLNRHMDYIHYNPVKHGMVEDPFEYKYSSLSHYYEQGTYERKWGVKEIKFDGDFGE